MSRQHHRCLVLCYSFLCYLHSHFECCYHLDSYFMCPFRVVLFIFSLHLELLLTSIFYHIVSLLSICIGYIIAIAVITSIHNHCSKFITKSEIETCCCFKKCVLKSYSHKLIIWYVQVSMHWLVLLFRTKFSSIFTFSNRYSLFLSLEI